MPPKLDRAQVVDAALRLLDETGLEGLTLRRIATELDVKAPALYWHFANKQALLDEMATEMLRRMYAGPVGVPGSWQEAITTTCRTLRTALLGYRDGARVFSGTRLTDYGHAEGQEALLAAFRRAGFELADAVLAFTTAYAFTTGFVIEEQAVHPVPGERAPPTTRTGGPPPSTPGTRSPRPRAGSSSGTSSGASSAVWRSSWPASRPRSARSPRP